LEDTGLSNGAVQSSDTTARPLFSIDGYTGTFANFAATKRILNTGKTWRTLRITTSAIDWSIAAANRGTVAAKTVITGIIDTDLVETAITDRRLLLERDPAYLDDKIGETTLRIGVGGSGFVPAEYDTTVTNCL
jgi:hypothetical protein